MRLRHYTPLLSDSKASEAFVEERQSIAWFARDANASAVDNQKSAADQRGRKSLENFKVGDSVLLWTAGIQDAFIFEPRFEHIFSAVYWSVLRLSECMVMPTRWMYLHLSV